MEPPRNNPDSIELGRHLKVIEGDAKPEGVSTRSRADALAASDSVATWSVLGVGGFLGGATIFGLGATLLPPLLLPGAVIGLAGAACLGLSTLRQGPIARHLWRFGDRVLAVSTGAGLVAGLGALVMGVSGLILVGQSMFSAIGEGPAGEWALLLMQVGGAVAVIGAILGLVLYGLHNLFERKSREIP